MLESEQKLHEHDLEDGEIVEDEGGLVPDSPVQSPAKSPVERPETPIDPLDSLETPGDSLEPLETPVDSLEPLETPVDHLEPKETPVDPQKPLDTPKDLPKTKKKRYKLEDIVAHPFNVPDHELLPRLQFLVEHQWELQATMIKRQECIRKLQSEIEEQEKFIEGLKPDSWPVVSPAPSEIAKQSEDASKFQNSGVIDFKTKEMPSRVEHGYPEPRLPSYRVGLPAFSPSFSTLPTTPIRYGYHFHSHGSHSHGSHSHGSHSTPRRLPPNRGFPHGYRYGHGGMNNYHRYQSGSSYHVPFRRGRQQF